MITAHLAPCLALCLSLLCPGIALGQTADHSADRDAALGLSGVMDVAPLALQPGPPTEGFPHNVGQCWALGALSPEAQGIRVTLGVERSDDGHPLQDTIRLLSATDGGAQAVEQAFQSARRAILRCAAADPDLRPLTAADPRALEITFDPSGPSDR